MLSILDLQKIITTQDSINKIVIIHAVLLINEYGYRLRRTFNKR